MSTTSNPPGRVLDQHLIHLVSPERLQKIQNHNPVLSPYHRDHFANPVLDALPKTLSISPAELGGDPTGRRDSTAAVQAAVDRCYARAASQNASAVPFPYRGTVGAGNCEVYLGGTYTISKPIVTPSFSNFIFGYGALVAANNWSAPAASNFLLHNYANQSQQYHHFPELYLDGQRRTNGLRLNTTYAMTIGPGTVVQRFIDVGIHVTGGYEVMIDRTWVAELPLDIMHPTATGILIEGSDHDVTNSVVWSSLIGLHIQHSGGDVLVTGVHNWYIDNVELTIPGNMLYLVDATGSRFGSCMINTAF